MIDQQLAAADIGHLRDGEMPLFAKGKGLRVLAWAIVMGFLSAL